MAGGQKGQSPVLHARANVDRLTLKQAHWFRQNATALFLSSSWTTWMLLPGDGLHIKSTPLLRSGTRSKESKSVRVRDDLMRGQ